MRLRGDMIRVLSNLLCLGIGSLLVLGCGPNVESSEMSLEDMWPGTYAHGIPPEGIGESGTHLNMRIFRADGTASSYVLDCSGTHTTELIYDWRVSDGHTIELVVTEDTGINRPPGEVYEQVVVDAGQCGPNQYLRSSGTPLGTLVGGRFCPEALVEGHISSCSFVPCDDLAFECLAKSLEE